MRKTNTTILVTGGAGFIGSHLVPTLLEKGYSVTVFDNLTTGKIENLSSVCKNPNFTFIHGDIRKPTELQHALKNIQAMIHLAAQIDVADSVANPIRTHEINTTGTLNVLQQAAKRHIKKFVFASSTAIYGDTKSLPTKEDTPYKPISPYAASKVAGEAYCSAYANCYDLNTITLRFFNVYGTGNEGNPYSGVITKFIQKAIKNEPLPIEGDGEQTRDFIHAKDIANAITLALEHKAFKAEAFNVCTGKPTSINQLVEAIKTATGKNLQVTHAPKRTGDIKNSYGDPTKAARQLGFKASITLQEGLDMLYRSLGV